MPELCFSPCCDDDTPVTDYFRVRAGAAVIAKGGVPAFRGFARGQLVTRVQQHLSDFGPFRNDVALVVADGVNNGCWETVGGVWTRKVGFESAAGVTSTAFFANIDGPPWFAEGGTFATLVFDQGAQFPLKQGASGGGTYDAMFARLCWAWQCTDVAGAARWEMNRELLINTGSAYLSYMQAYGWLKALGVQIFDGAALGAVWESSKDGADTVRFTEPAFGWQPGTGATAVSNQVRFRPGIGFVPAAFSPGDFCRDVTGDGFGNPLDYVCVAAVTTNTGSGGLGSAVRPKLDETHWKRTAMQRGMPWDARPAAYESQGVFTTKVVPRKRYRNVTERTHAVLLAGDGVTVLDSTDGSRTWEFSRLHGADRDHWSYTQTSYVGCRNLYAGDPSETLRLQGAMVEFPSLPIALGGSRHTLVDTSANEASWTITIRTDFLPGGKKLLITQTVDLADEITNGEIEEAVIARAEGVFAGIVGIGNLQERRWSDGTAYYGAGPDGATASDAPPTPARPFMPYQVTFNPRPFAGEFNDAYFLAQHYRIETCKAAKFLLGDEGFCFSLTEGEYISGVRTGTWYKYDCGRSGEMVFDRAPDPARIRAWDYGDGYAPC